jgi:hypothetical protein
MSAPQTIVEAEMARYFQDYQIATFIVSTFCIVFFPLAEIKWGIRIFDLFFTPQDTGMFDFVLHWTVWYLAFFWCISILRVGVSMFQGHTFPELEKRKNMGK